MTHNRWTDAERLDACREALAMVLASHRGDSAAVLALWNGSANHPALVAARSELPAVAMSETAARFDARFDVEAALQDVAAGLAVMEPPTGEDNPQ